MTEVILTAIQVSSNCKKELELETKVGEYINFLTIRKIILQFLTCDRIIFIPTKVSKFTKLELANKLNITPKQLKRLLRSQSSCSYREMIGKINLPLIKLYCSTKWA